MTNSDGHNYFNLESWDVEVSNNGISWTLIDKHQKDSTLSIFNIPIIAILF